MGDSNPASHRFHAHGVDLHYVAWGRAEAPVLLLLHGGRDHARSWDDIAGALEGDWRIVAPDLRGHGDSGWVSDGQYDMFDFVLDLAALIDHLGADPVTIVAHSLGGNIALRYAGLYPERVRRLVVIEGLGPAPALIAKREGADPADHLRRWIAERGKASARHLRVYPDADAAVVRMRANNAHLGEVQARHLVAHGTRAVEGGLVFKYDPALMFFDNAVELDSARMHALWARIACPTLLVYGAESWASNPAEDGRVAHFRDARVELFADAGHWVQHDRRDDFIALLRDFL